MIDAIEDAERRLDKPVVNSNQVVLWAALRRLEITEPIAGLGRLFSVSPSSGPDTSPKSKEL
jgi:maleate cis-trans isomerase